MKAQKVLTTKILIYVLACIMLSLTLIPFLYNLTKKQYEPSYAAADFEISDPQTLDQFKTELKNNNFTGKTVVLTQNVDYDGGEWSPADSFGGTFDGQGHKISNIKLKSPSSTAAFFRFLMNGASVRNLQLDNVTVEDYSFGTSFCEIGILAAEVGGTVKLESINITNAKIGINMMDTNDYYEGHVGGLIGLVNLGANVMITNCSVQIEDINVDYPVEGNVFYHAGLLNLGGLVGTIGKREGNNNYGYTTVTIDECYTYIRNIKMYQMGDKENFTQTVKYTLKARFGGLVGSMSSSAAGTIQNSFSYIDSYRFGFSGRDKIQLGALIGIVVDEDKSTEPLTTIAISISNCAYNQEITNQNKLNDYSDGGFSKIDQVQINAGNMWIMNEDDITIGSPFKYQKNFYKKLGWDVGDLYG